MIVLVCDYRWLYSCYEIIGGYSLGVRLYVVIGLEAFGQVMLLHKSGMPWTKM